MLYQELPRIESTPLNAWGRWLVPAVVAGAAISAALLLLLIGQLWFAAAALSTGLVVAAVVLIKEEAITRGDEPFIVGPDFTLVGSALALGRDAAALTSAEGSLLIVNPAYRERFGGSRPPLELGADEQAEQGLQLARSMASRDGAGCVARVATIAGSSPVEVERVGAREELLLWRFPDPSPVDPLTGAVKSVQGLTGERLASAGVMAAVVDGKGRLLAANRLFQERALRSEEIKGTVEFGDVVDVGEDHRMRLVTSGEAAPPLRAVHVPADPDGQGGEGTFLLFEEGEAPAAAQASNLQALLDVLPIGLALVDRDGRFLTMNEAFRRAAWRRRRVDPSLSRRSRREGGQGRRR